MIDRRGVRILQLRNPWSRKGIPSFPTLYTTLSTPRNTNPNVEENNLPDANPDSGDEEIANDPSVGTFWITYPTLSQAFKTLYVNWNPSLFNYSTSKHFSFTPNGSDFDVRQNGQYIFSINQSKSGEVEGTKGGSNGGAGWGGGVRDMWVLLERHYLGKLEGWDGYIGLAVFPGNERIYSYNTRALYRVTPPSLPLFAPVDDVD